MITLDCASGNILIPKVETYSALIKKIKTCLSMDEELFKYLYLSYIDDEEQERVRLIPQIFDEFINQEFPKISIGFNEDLDQNILQKMMKLIEQNKKNYPNKENYVYDDEEEKKENEYLNRSENNDFDSDNKNLEIFNKEMNDLKNIINIEDNNNKEISNKEKENQINIEKQNRINKQEQLIEKEKVKEKNIVDKEIKKEFGENNLEKTVYNIIESQLNNLKTDIFNEIIPEVSKIEKESKIYLQNKQKNNKSNKYSNVHNNFKCDQCGVMPIVGIRYKCIECNCFNLCEKCEAFVKHPHPFYKLKYYAISAKQ